MKIVRLVNFFLAVLGVTAASDRRVRFHSQNLNEPAATVEQAIAGVVESALRSRRRYDGNVMAAYSAPVA